MFFSFIIYFYRLTSVVQINGHTDSDGSEQFNLKLSEERALSVDNYLRENGNVEHLNMSTAGFGETQPIVPNTNDENKAKNRRVEIVINPNE